MALNPSDLRSLVEVALLTREEELDCDACLERVAAYAEVHLAGLPTPEALRLVGEHLAMCGDCREEFSALAAALKDERT
jgi:predicted anti-sigma-YlaC factor YlaD